ncbi:MULTISPECIES: type V toxin-antitoxin system endoribonuclease antitoxin GhoS [Photorhabdus]|uniref:type V toxin-antitoxin system endoribonuclease antitoxin GhoS n=1 Tax=Photorhabdus TaxID=29487 RepID=UPI001BD21143|nr:MULTISPECIES: type V toxin-antitoxin system endoribonuclease antitoxin GhoS [Photorhabdus]MBS9422266.1 endoribonuclease GhoS [Photorhabdus caribbeanensis]MBS9442272.1 endoribonuclease GhoS [Photorhabdus heterorhabditis]
MANYLVRVEIYDADYSDYETLHKKMLAIGFYKYIKYSDGKSHDLPSGTYFGKSSLSPSQIRDKVKSVASPLSSKDPSLFVCKFQASEWSSLLYASE